MIRTNPSKLGLAAMLTVGVAGFAQAQLAVSLPSVSWNDPVATLGGTNVNNVVYSATSTSNFFLSTSVTLTGGSVTRINTNSGTSSFGFRMRNSAHPGAWADFTVLSTAFVANTASITTAIRSLGGSLSSAAIASGSTFTFEAFSSVTTGAITGATEATGSVNFNLGSTAFTSTIRESFTFSTGFDLPLNATTTAGTNTVTATATAEYILTAPTLTNGGIYTSLTNSTSYWANDVRATAFNSAYPTLSAAWRPRNHGSGSSFASGTSVSWAGIGGSLTGALVGSLISAGTTWTFAVDTSFDAAPTGPDMNVANLAFSFTGDGLPPFDYDSGVLPGPFNAGGSPFSADNSTVTLPPVVTPFVMGSNVAFQGTANRVLTSSLASELRVRVRNSAYPSSWSLEAQPTTASFSTAGALSVANFAIVSPSPLTLLTGRLQSTLRGLNIPAGSTFSLEFYDVNDNGAGADATWSNVRVRFQAGPAAGSGTVPSSVTDLGVMSDAYSTVATAFSHDITPGIVGNEVRWFKFNLPASSAGQLGRYLHIWGEGPVADALDSTFALFDASGRLLAFDQDSGASNPIQFNAAITFGTEIVAPWTIAVGDLPLNGRDGDGLPAGNYYLGVAPYGTAVNAADGFVFTTNASGTATLLSTIKIVTNVPAPPANQIVTLPLNFQSATDPFAVSRTLRYSVMQGTTTVVSSTNFTANAASQSVAITIPASVTGGVTIEVDGAQYLKRKIAANLTGSNQTLGSETVKPGDVDNSTEVDLTDIDLIIGDYLGTGGTTEGTITDLDNSGEVDLTDIDIAIGNYLLGDDN